AACRTRAGGGLGVHLPLSTGHSPWQPSPIEWGGALRSPLARPIDAMQLIAPRYLPDLSLLFLTVRRFQALASNRVGTSHGFTLCRDAQCLAPSSLDKDSRPERPNSSTCV